jgi:hypothetical protein
MSRKERCCKRFHRFLNLFGRSLGKFQNSGSEMTLGKHLKHFSTDHLMEMADVTNATISNWRNNRVIPHAGYHGVLRGMLHKTEDEFAKILKHTSDARDEM